MPFTPEELAAMAAADAEIEAEFRLTPEDLARSRDQDREAPLPGGGGRPAGEDPQDPVSAVSGV